MASLESNQLHQLYLSQCAHHGKKDVCQMLLGLTYGCVGLYVVAFKIAVVCTAKKKQREQVEHLGEMELNTFTGEATLK